MGKSRFSGVVPHQQLSDVFINHRSAQSIADIDGRKGLSQKDVTNAFQLRDAQAALLMQKIFATLSQQTGSVHFRFSELPKQTMAEACVDGSKANPVYPQESCLVVDVNTAEDEVALRNVFSGWNPKNTEVMHEWYGYLTTLSNPASRVAVFDYDDTLVPDSIGPSVVKVGVKMGKIRFQEKIPIKDQLYAVSYVREKFRLSDVEFDQMLAGTLPEKIASERGIVKYDKSGIKNPYDWWQFLADNTFGPVDGNYCSMAFNNITIGDLAEILVETERQYPALFRTAYPQMVRWVNDMNNRGMCTAVVSASNYAVVAYGLLRNGYKVPLYAVHGTDFYVVHPTTGNHVLFSDLVNAEFLVNHPHATILDALEFYKDVKIVNLVDQVHSGGEGKGAASNAIVDRHVYFYNRTHPGKPLTRSHLRLSAYFGDNSLPRNDMPEMKPIAVGGDQGMLRTLVPDEFFLMGNVDRGVGSKQGDGVLNIDYSRKAGNTNNYYALVKEFLYIAYGISTEINAENISSLRSRYPTLIHFYPVHQGGVSRGEGIGTFDAR